MDFDSILFTLTPNLSRQGRGRFNGMTAYLLIGLSVLPRSTEIQSIVGAGFIPARALTTLASGRG
jgi:hypothetical protein